MASDSVYRPTITFADGAHLSSVLDIRRLAPRGLGLYIPNGWTAADILFQSGDLEDGSDMARHYQFDPTDISVPIGAIPTRLSGILTNAAGIYALPASLWVAGAWPYLQLHSVQAGTTTNQAQSGAKTLKLVVLR